MQEITFQESTSGKIVESIQELLVTMREDRSLTFDEVRKIASAIRTLTDAVKMIDQRNRDEVK